MPVYAGGCYLPGLAAGEDLQLTDTTENNATTSRHGFLRKLSGTSTEFLAGDGAWRTPAGLVQSATVSLTDDQIKALPRAYVELVAAPGDDHVLVCLGGMLQAETTAGVYTNTNGYLLIAHGDWNTDASIAVRAVTLLNNLNYIACLGAPGLNLVSGVYMTGAIAGYGDMENQPLKLVASNGGSDFTGGDPANSLRVTTFYIAMAL